MPTLVITRGLPASGKSTYAKVWVAEGKNRVRLERDVFRDMLFGTRLSLTFDKEESLTSVQRAAARDALKKGLDVIISDTNLRSKYVREWAKLAAEAGANFEIKSFLAVPVDECIRRDAQRDEKERVGEDVIHSLHNRFFPIPKLKLDDIEPLKVEPYVPVFGTPYAYMVDIDGTCTTGPCDRSPYEWAKVGQDQPNESVIRTVKRLYDSGYAIIFCSGRDEVCRPETMDWLAEHFGAGRILNSSLFMRAEGDNRKDSIVKMELFDKHIRNNYNVIAVFDDRKQVVDMWRSLGLTVFQVDEGEF